MGGRRSRVAPMPCYAEVDPSASASARLEFNSALLEAFGVSTLGLSEQFLTPERLEHCPSELAKRSAEEAARAAETRALSSRRTRLGMTVPANAEPGDVLQTVMPSGLKERSLSCSLPASEPSPSIAPSGTWTPNADELRCTNTEYDSVTDSAASSDGASSECSEASLPLEMPRGAMATGAAWEARRAKTRKSFERKAPIPQRPKSAVIGGRV